MRQNLTSFAKGGEKLKQRRSIFIMVHILKELPQFFEAVKSGKKTFEVRKKDRDYKVGDYIVLNEYDISRSVNLDGYTGSSIFLRIVYILDDDRFCKNGFVILAFEHCKIKELRGRYNPLGKGI